MILFLINHTKESDKRKIFAVLKEYPLFPKS